MKKIKSIFCILLAFAMIFLCACGDSSQDDSEEEANSVRYNVPAASVKKAETVYVNLDNTGKRKLAAVVALVIKIGRAQRLASCSARRRIC